MDEQKLLNLEFNQITNLEKVIPLILDQKELTNVSLHGNRLKCLPKSLAELAHIEAIDISGNMFTVSLESLLESLKTLPKLRSLTITLSLPEDQEKVLSYLPLLARLNGEEVQKQKIIPSSITSNIMRKISTKPSEIDRREIELVADLYDQITEISPSVSESLASHLELVLADLHHTSKTAKPIFKALFALKARFALADTAITKAADVLEGQGELGAALASIIKNALNLLLVAFRDQAELATPEDRSGLDDLREATKRTGFDGNKTTDKAARQAESLIAALDEEIVSLKLERSDLISQVKQLERENVEAMKALARFTRQQAEDLGIPKSAVLESQPPARKKPSKAQVNDVRALSNEILRAKELADAKARQTGSPLEPPEEFIYSFFKQRYGLKQLILEHAKELIEGIQAVKDFDIEVSLFAKVLRSEIDQGYVATHNSLRRAIFDALKAFLQAKHPYMPSAKVQDLASEIRQKGFLKPEDYRDILSSFLSKNALAKFEELADGFDFSFAEFEEQVLHFKMLAHESSLRQFNALYRRSEMGNRGYLTSDQVSNVLEEINIELSKSGCTISPSEFMKLVDFSGTGRLTYSQIVEYLKHTTFVKQGKEMSLLQIFNESSR